jgi:uncharacterized protein
MIKLKVKMKYLIWIFLGLLLSASVQATGFGCVKALTTVEKLICASQVLSELDSQLELEYARSRERAISEDARKITSEQKDWLKNIRNKCADQSCLNSVYSSRIEALNSAVAPTAPLSILANFTDFRTDDYPITQYNEKLYFSQYDKSGNNFDVMSFDIAKQTSEVVLAGRYGGKFIAQDEKYLIVSEKAQLTNPLIVIDRKSGKQVKQIKLQQIISWAKIEGNHLIAIQGAWLSGGYQSTAHALIFELPSLKILKSVDIVGGNDVQFWQGKILSLGYNLAAYDLELKEQFKIDLPKRKIGNVVSCEATWPLRVYENKAVIVANCGEILIYDLSTRQLEHTIPPYSHFYAVAILDGLIFTIPTSEPRQKDSAHVYDIFTGKELAVLPLNGSGLFSEGNRLLVVESKFAARSPMTLYAVNTSAIRNGQFRINQVLQQCQLAETQLANTKDLYGAIGLCKAAGIEGLIDEASNFPSIQPVLEKYAFWLSQTFDKGHDAIRILEKLQIINPEKNVDNVLNEVRLRTKVIEGLEFSELNAQELQTKFSHVLEWGSKYVNATTVGIEFGAFSNLFHFSGERIYIGRYGCRSCSGGGASIGILDRSTLQEVASIPLVSEDNDFQDGVKSIASDENKIYVSVEYRYEQAGRTNFFVIDKKTLKVIKKSHGDSVATLNFDGGKLMSCGCHFTEDQHCVAIDPVSMKSASAPGKFCVQNETDKESIVGFNQTTESTPKFVAATKDYLISHDSYLPDAPYNFYSRTGEKPNLSKQGFGDALKWPISVDGNSILVSEAVRGGVLTKLVSVPDGKTRTLFGLPATKLRSPVATLYKQRLYAGYGRDLFVFDLATSSLVRYIKDYIPEGFADNGNGLDTNRITRLIIDRGRLIAITFNGWNSRFIRLNEL